MSRIIRFRAWDKTQETMIRSELVELGWSVEQLTTNNNFEIMQFTGLKDKNGKEIFEGDIVRCFGGENYLATIVWNHGGFEMKWHKESIRTVEGMQEPLLTNITIDAEIIGNVFEHPTLLDNKEGL